VAANGGQNCKGNIFKIADLSLQILFLLRFIFVLLQHILGSSNSYLDLLNYNEMPHKGKQGIKTILQK